MLDFGWQEFMLIAIVTVLVVGPKELPRVFRTITGFMKKARSLAGEFQGAMNEIAREADLEDLKKEAQKIKKGESDWVKDIDPTGEVGDSMRAMKDEVEQTRTAVNQAGRAPAAGSKKAESKKAAAKTAAAPKAPAAKKATAKKASVKKTAAKKASVKKTSAKKAAPKKAAAKTGGDAA